MKFSQSSLCLWGQCSFCQWNLCLHRHLQLFWCHECAKCKPGVRCTWHCFWGGRKQSGSLSEMDIICSVRWGINTCFIHKLGRKISDLWVFTRSHSSYLLKMKLLNSLLFIFTVPIGEGLYQGSNFCQMGAKCPLTDCSHSGTGILSWDLKYLEADGFLFKYMFGMYFCLQEKARMGKGEVSYRSWCCIW